MNQKLRNLAKARRSNLRGWLALTKSMAHHKRCTDDQGEGRQLCDKALKRLKPPYDTVTDADIVNATQALEFIANAFGHPSKAHGLGAAAPGNIRQDGHIMDVPLWWTKEPTT